jgi:mannose/fructose/N-acetylgalactosamine-specific phosphotransferase system component IIC
MNTLKVSAWLGLVLSAIGVFLKIVRVLRQPEWWPFFLYDYIAAAILAIGAIAVLRGGRDGRWLAAGWGFGAAMAYGSFFGHLERWITKSGLDLSFERTMSYSVGILLAVNVIGLTLALWKAGEQADSMRRN